MIIVILTSALLFEFFDARPKKKAAVPMGFPTSTTAVHDPDQLLDDWGLFRRPYSRITRRIKNPPFPRFNTHLYLPTMWSPLNQPPDKNPLLQ